MLMKRYQWGAVKVGFCETNGKKPDQFDYRKDDATIWFMLNKTTVVWR